MFDKPFPHLTPVVPPDQQTKPWRLRTKLEISLLNHLKPIPWSHVWGLSFILFSLAKSPSLREGNFRCGTSTLLDLSPYFPGFLPGHWYFPSFTSLWDSVLMWRRKTNNWVRTGTGEPVPYLSLDYLEESFLLLSAANRNLLHVLPSSLLMEMVRLQLRGWWLHLPFLKAIWQRIKERRERKMPKLLGLGDL